MELQLISSSLPFLFCVLIFTIFMVLKMMGKTSNSNPTSLPPGPWKLPLIGNMHQMIGSQLPHHKLRDLSQKYGPLMHLQLGEVSSVVVSSPEILKEIIKKHDINFAYRPSVLAVEIIVYGCTNISFSPYGEYWRQLRKICSLELLSARRVESFQSIREEEVLDLVDSISSNAGSPINLSEKVLSLAYAIISKAAFGKETKDIDRFNIVAKECIKLAAGFHVGDLFPSCKWLPVITGMRSKLQRLHSQADKILTTIIEDHLKNQKNKVVLGDDAAAAAAASSKDLVDVLLNFVEHDHDHGFCLTRDNIKAVIFDMFLGGSDTTTTVVNWAMVEIMKNSRILNKIQSEVRHKFDKRGIVEEDGLPQLQYLQLVIKETLRLHPRIVLIPRECKERCEVGGFEIPVKTKVIVNTWAIGRDPNYWEEAEKFYPERFLDSPIDFNGNHFEYIPFGTGRRICPGMTFALTTIAYQLAVLLFHFDWKVPNNGELDMTEEFGATVSKKK